ncbi:IS21 family transposase [Dyadobacter frigoris]|nr:IS21 family transposase [Dyadobacter frigoris]
MYTKPRGGPQEIILQFYREGKSQRSICKTLGISRKTVQKYISDYATSSSTASQETASLNEYLTKTPAYNAENRGKRRLTNEIQQAIDNLLLLNEDNKQQGLVKQLLKKCDIFDQLQSQGFSIGYTSVCNYIKDKKQAATKPKEAYIRQLYAPGSVCEFDWAEVKLRINGELCRYQLAVFTSAYSNYRYARLFSRQDTLSFMEAHIAFFDLLGYVYQELVYDNMRVAVARFVGKHEKQPTDALLQLRGHYGFTHRFCNVRRGNEKGHVERSVEYVRRKSLSLKSTFDDLDQANAWLYGRVDQLNSSMQQLSGKTAIELLDEEKCFLRPSPLKLTCAEQAQLRAAAAAVDKYSAVSYRTNRYSVPDHLVGEFVDVRIMSQELFFYHKNTKIATHFRSYGKHDWLVSIDHYLDTFRKKPGAPSRGLWQAALPWPAAVILKAFMKNIFKISQKTLFIYYPFAKKTRCLMPYSKKVSSAWFAVAFASRRLKS